MDKIEKITVSGVTFSADQVESVVVKIGNRKIEIGKKEQEDKKIGFEGKKDE